jgi:hypothetical protein
MRNILTFLRRYASFIFCCVVGMLISWGLQSLLGLGSLFLGWFVAMFLWAKYFDWGGL